MLWFVPEYLGSGDLFRAASRAREPNPDSAAFASVPFIETFRRSGSVLMVPLLLGAVIALVRAWLDRDRLRLALGAIAAALMVAVAAMTQAGFAGNLRYVALPAALVCVLAGAGWVDLVRDAAARFGRPRGAALAAMLAVAAVPFVVADVDKLAFDLDVVRAESELYDRLPPIVAKAGGAEALLRVRPRLRAAVRGPGGRVGDARALLPGRHLRVAAGHGARGPLLGARARPALPGDQQEPPLVRRSQLPRRDALT